MDERECANFSYNDDPSEMLLARRIAHYLSRYNWYYPQRNRDDSNISLDKAWEFFEHVTLDRYEVENEDSEYTVEGTKLLKRAVTGERDKKTKLYPIFGRESHLEDFGCGIAIYFRTLRTLSVVFLIAFLINLPLWFFYDSPAYSLNQNDIPLHVRGSAICTNMVWKPCPSCEAQNWSFAKDRFATVNKDESNKDLTFVLVNDCHVDSKMIFSSWVACVFVITSLFFLRRNYEKYAINLDEKFATPSDYTIAVLNSPDDATDSEEWKTFFSSVCETGDVVACTISLHNADLINALKERKLFILKLERMLPTGLLMDESNLDDLLDQFPSLPWWQKLFSASPKSLVDKIHETEKRIVNLAKKRYPVSAVFITFNKEETKRRVLKEFSTSDLAIMQQKISSIPSRYLFRGKHVLKLIHPVEPSSFLWSRAKKPLMKEIMLLIISISLSVTLVIGGGIIVYYCKNYINGIYLGLTASSLAISALNTISPRVIKFFVEFENQRTEGDKQKSIFASLTFFRWANTAFILYIITPFTHTLTATELLITVFSIFYTEMLSTPVTFLSDYMGHFKRHILAPRAPDQILMNLQFSGEPYLLAERFTDMSKIVLATFFYAALFPMGFLFASICLIFHYIVARFCLSRSWQRTVDLGPILPRFANHTSGLTLIVFAVMACYMWSGFPYDNCCEYGGNDKIDIIFDYQGNHLITGLDGIMHNVTVSNDDKVYNYCAQDIPFKLSAISSMLWFEDNKKWMSKEQITIIGLYAWTLVLVFGIQLCGLAVFLKKTTWSFFVNRFEDKQGRPLLRHFWASPWIQAYIPRIPLEGYSLPFFICDLKHIDMRFMPRKPQYDDYNDRNLFHDLLCIIAKSGLQSHEIAHSMSSVKMWQPQYS